MTPRERELIASEELSANETLLWSGAPNAWRSIGTTWGLCIFGVVWTIFLWSFWAASTGHGGQDPFSQIASLAFILIGIVMIFSPATVYLNALRTIYGVTNQRIMIIQQGRKRKVQSFDRLAINILEYEEETDGSGTVTFSRSVYKDNDGDRKVRKEQFIGIPDARDVERLIRETLNPEFKPVDGAVSLRPPDLTPDASREARERIGSHFLIAEEGNTLRIARRREQDWRMRRSGIGGSLGCSAFLSVFLVGMAGTGVIGHPLVNPLTGYFQLLWDIFAVIVASCIYWSVVTVLFGIWGSEEWVISEDLFVVRACMFGIRWEKRWSDCGIKITRAVSGNKVSNTLYVWDLGYVLRMRLMILSEDRIEDIQLLADLLTRYTGWPLLFEAHE